MRLGLTQLIVLSFLSAAIDAKAEDLPLASDPLLTRVLTGFYVLAELGGTGDRNNRYYVRVLGIAVDGECDGRPETCPKQQAAIALADDGEEPERRVYFLPEAFGWTFGEWEKTPQSFDAENDAIQFVIVRKVVGPDPTKGWWAEERYRVRVNFDSASMHRIEE